MKEVIVHLGYSNYNDRSTTKQINLIRLLYERLDDEDTFYQFITRNGMENPQYWINKTNASILIDALQKDKPIRFIDFKKIK